MVAQTSEKSQGIVNVEVRPGQPIKCRTIRPTRTVEGFVIADEHRPAISRVVTPVKSRIPESEYQADLDSFREALNDRLNIEVRQSSSSTDRGEQTWWEIVDRSEPTIFLDVSECNHVPVEIFGHRNVDAGCNKVDVHWVAHLISVERIDEGNPSEPARNVAGYRVYVDESKKGGAV